MIKMTPTGMRIAPLFLCFLLYSVMMEAQHKGGKKGKTHTAATVTVNGGAGVAKQKGKGPSFEDETDKWDPLPDFPDFDIELPPIDEFPDPWDIPMPPDDLPMPPDPWDLPDPFPDDLPTPNDGAARLHPGMYTSVSGYALSRLPHYLQHASLYKKTRRVAANYLSPGFELGLAWKGGKVTNGNETTKTSLMYLRIPVYVRFSHMYKDHSRLFVGTGPYFAFGLSGHYKTDAGKVAVHFGNNDNSDFKRTDIGWNIHVGYKFGKIPFTAKLFYDLGLNNILPGPGGGDVDKIKNRLFGLQVGYLLYKKRMFHHKK